MSKTPLLELTKLLFVMFQVLNWLTVGFMNDQCSYIAPNKLYHTLITELAVNTAA